jgi:quercetin dioxygenase-like cupin family protein
MDTTQLNNGKHFFGKYTDFAEYQGWFVGSFFPDGHPCKTDQVEVLYREHKQGDVCSPHYHSHKIELLIILEGKAKYTVNGNKIVLSGGDFLFVGVNNIVSGEFLEPTKFFAIHSPSLPKDKTLVK